MKKLELDDQGKLTIGPVSGAKPGKINIAFESNDTSGLALNVEATPGNAADENQKAVVKLGAFTIGQDALGEEDGAFGIAGAAGEPLLHLSLTKSILTWTVAYNDAVQWHQYADQSLAGLVAVAAVQADCNARANALKANAALHAASVGSWNLDTGSHKAADATASATLAAVPAATDLATSITLCTALHTWIVAHLVEAGVHFHDDVATDTTVTDSTPADLAAVAVCLNELTGVFTAHYASGYPTVASTI